MSLYANLQWTQTLQQVLLRFNPLVIHYVFSRIMVDQNQNIFVHRHNDIGHDFLVTELEHEYKTYRTDELIIIYELYFLLLSSSHSYFHLYPMQNCLHYQDT
jgi:hypothetical protein